jgi:membrane protease YdiL (CAAX protease family)
MPPGFTGIGLAGYFHLLFFGVVLPRAAIRSAKLMAERPLPPRRKHFLMVLIQQTVLVGLSLLVAYAEQINLFPRPQHLSVALPVTLTFLTACLALMWPHWRRNVLQRERKVYFFMPRDKSEKFIWVAIALAAGIGEEITYRGVLYTLLMRLVGHPLLAVLLAAGIFSVSHFVQGWKSVTVIFLFSLGFHAIVLLSGSLFLAMAAHFVYDLIAGLAYSHFGEKFNYPLEGIENEFQSVNAANN